MASARLANHSLLLGPGISVTTLRSWVMSIPEVCSFPARRVRRGTGVERRSGLYGTADQASLSAPPGGSVRPLCTITSMAVAVRDVVSIPGASLRFLAGERFAARPVRWVHISEMDDPT